MDKLISKIGFLLFLLGAGGMDSQNQIVPAVMVLLGLAILAISAFVERREKHGISYRVLEWEMPQLRKQQKRLDGMAFYIEERSDNRYPKKI